VIPNLEAEVLSTMISKGFPTDEDFKALFSLAGTIAEKHKSMYMDDEVLPREG
jgi:hypothetical protein